MARVMLVCLLLLSRVAGAEEWKANETAGGAVLGPAVLPEGQTTTAAWLGVPEVGGSWRHGLWGGQSDVEARFRFDYLLLSATLEGLARRQFGWAGGGLVPQVGGGVVLDSGARYVFRDNTPGVWLRLSPGLVYSLAEVDSRPPIFVTWRAALPLELGVGTPGAWRWLASLGVGLEVALERDLWLMGGLEFGGGPSYRPGEELEGTGFFHLRVGVALREY